MSRPARQARRVRKREHRQARRLRGSSLRAGPAWATVIQAFAFVRKELVEILRQPKLLVLLVGGPFLLLLLFGAGYGESTISMRTMFVARAGSMYEEAISGYHEELADYIVFEGFTSDRDAALALLDQQRVDVVVTFPDDALDQILAGQSAEIEILHNKIDPFQQVGVSIAARLAVQEVNSSILSVIAGGAQQALRSVDELAVELTDRSGRIARAVENEDPDEVARVSEEIAAVVEEASTVLDRSRDVVERLGGAAEDQVAVLDRLDELGAAARRAGEAKSGDVMAESGRIGELLEQITAELPRAGAVSPQVLVRPFQADVSSVSPVRIDPADYYTPSSLVLLLTHLALTFAALSLVRDRELGLFELLRMGPLSSIEILAGKTIAYFLVGLGVGAALVAAAVYGLDVPFLGSGWWAALVVALVLLASLGMGTVISLISGTETQAVQYAMLSLLAGMFFSGFVLDIESMAYPVRLVSYVLPVTFGISAMQDIMLRGRTPEALDLIGLVVLVAVYGCLATGLLRRRLARL